MGKKHSKISLTSLCLGFVSFLFFFFPIDDVQTKNQGENGVAKYWQNVGRYLSNAMTKYDSRR